MTTILLGAFLGICFGLAGSGGSTLADRRQRRSRRIDEALKEHVTRDDAIQIAHTLAGKGWPWTEPLLVEEGRRFAGFGRRYWRVTTNTKYADIGHNVHVRIDDQTRQILSSDYVPTQTS